MIDAINDYYFSEEHWKINFSNRFKVGRVISNPTNFL